MIRLLAALLALLCTLSCASSEETTLMVYGAASLEDVLVEAAEDWSAASGVRVRFNFSGSNELTRQLLAGAHADVIFSANTEELERLVEAKLVDSGTVASFVSNRMVLITQRGASIDFDAQHSIALAEASVPVGRYARGWMKERTESALLGGDLRTISTINARATLGAVEAGAVELGIVYYSDAMSSNSVVVLEDQGPDEAPAIAYPAAVLRDAREPILARSFVAFLETRRALFERHGFRFRP